MRIYESNVELSEEGARVTSLHERRPQGGTEKLYIEDYHLALIAAACFGTTAQYRTVAQVAEDAYRNPGSTSPSDLWAYIRAWKALLLGNEDAARREIEAACTSRERARKPDTQAFIAILDRDQKDFERHLQDGVKHFEKDARKQQGDPLTAIFLPGLALCRAALDRGMMLAERPYLPIRLLTR
jgi:hypothetical protein